VSGPAAPHGEGQCILCGREPGPETYWTPEIVRCPCGLVYTDQRRARPPGELYGKSFFEGQEAYHDYQAERAVLQRNFRNHLDVLARYKPHGRLLEIGCAFGFCLELARERWDATGIDISAHAVEHAVGKLGLRAVAASYLEHDVPPESLDVICLWDTVEHLDRPDAFLEKAARELKPDGILALTTGDIGSLNARLRGRK
jgi:SAM-dependent methyltransferase